MTQPPGHGSPGDPGVPPGRYGPGQPAYGPPQQYPQYGAPPGYHAQPPTHYGPPPGQYGPPPGWYGGGFEAPKPGCVPLRPLGVGDILDGAFRALRRNPRTMLGASVGFAFIEVVLSTVVTLFVFSNLADSRLAADNGNLGPLLGSDGLQFATLFITVLLGAVLTGMLTTVVTQDVLGKRIDLATVWAQVAPRIGTLVLLAIVTALLEFLGVLACIAPGVWLWGIWAVAVPACIVEKTGVGASLARSRQLVSGGFWRVWGIRALGYLVVSVVSYLIVIPFAVLAVVARTGNFNDILSASGTPVGFLLIVNVGTLIARTLTAPVSAGIDALLYVDLRMRKEGLDIVLQQAAAAPKPMTAG